MSRSRRITAAWALSVSALLIGLLSTSGCSLGSGATGASKPAHDAPASGVIARSASARFPGDAPGQVSASCQAGSQMIGGGFAASDVFEYAASIIASYPSSANTWTVTAGSSSTFILEGDVYCLASTPSLGVQIVQTSAASTSGASCPTGAIQLSDGFNHSTSQSYALCAAQRVSADATATMRYNPHSSSHSYYPGSATLACPAGQTAISGDSSGGDTTLASQSTGTPYQSWFFTVGGDSDQTLSVRCVTFAV